MEAAEDRKNVLWYRTEAKNWMEALPLGNGRLGAMLYGGALDEKIQVDESTSGQENLRIRTICRRQRS